jgi:hypothetical protein
MLVYLMNNPNPQRKDAMTNERILAFEAEMARQLVQTIANDKGVAGCYDELAELCDSLRDTGYRELQSQIEQDAERACEIVGERSRQQRANINAAGAIMQSALPYLASHRPILIRDRDSSAIVFIDA